MTEGRFRYFPACCCSSCCICCSAWLESSAKRMPTRAECFINFSQHFCTHCRAHRPQLSASAADALLLTPQTIEMPSNESSFKETRIDDCRHDVRAFRR